MTTEDSDRFDTEDIFDDDYLHFYEQWLTDEASDRNTQTIWNLLGLKQGDKVLDLACGHGRIANRLAKKGAQVTGLDSSARFLDLAREDARTRNVEVEYVGGDMRAIPWVETFDAIVCWFTSFGYFPDEENRQVLEGAFQALKPGGKFLVEMNHRDAIVGRYRQGESAHVVTAGEDDYMIDRGTFDPRSGRIRTVRLLVRDGNVRNAHFFVRLLSFTELRGWLEKAGFEGVEGFGADSQPLSLASYRMAVTAEKPGA